MNSFTFLTNNPPIAAVATFSSDPLNPTLSLGQPFGVVGPGGPPDMISPTRHLPNARKNQWSFDVQRELWSGTALDVQYVGSNTSHLDRSFFNNTPQPGEGAVDPRRPNPRFRSRRIIQNDLIADYDAVSVILRRRMSQGLQADVHYTWSRTRDMATDSNGGGQTMNNYDIWADYGPANWDVPHRFVASYIYDVPFLKDSSQPILKHVVAGWQVGGVTTLQSGLPINVTIAADRANIGISGVQRPNLVGAVPKLNCQKSPTNRDLIDCFDPSAFAMPAPFTFGNAPRNLLRGPKSVITDLSMAKNIAVGQNMRLQVRVEIFNAFNNVNYGQPNAIFSSATFGRISATSPTYPNMRQMQLGLKLIFLRCDDETACREASRPRPAQHPTAVDVESPAHAHIQSSRSQPCRRFQLVRCPVWMRPAVIHASEYGREAESSSSGRLVVFADDHPRHNGIRCKRDRGCQAVSAGRAARQEPLRLQSGSPKRRRHPVLRLGRQGFAPRD